MELKINTAAFCITTLCNIVPTYYLLLLQKIRVPLLAWRQWNDVTQRWGQYVTSEQLYTVTRLCNFIILNTTLSNLIFTKL